MVIMRRADVKADINRTLIVVDLLHLLLHPRKIKPLYLSYCLRAAIPGTRVREPEMKDMFKSGICCKRGHISAR